MVLMGRSFSLDCVATLAELLSGVAGKRPNHLAIQAKFQSFGSTLPTVVFIGDGYALKAGVDVDKIELKVRRIGKSLTPIRPQSGFPDYTAIANQLLCERRSKHNLICVVR
jgi:hypothetical protein